MVTSPAKPALLALLSLLSLLVFSAEEAMTLLKDALGERAGDVDVGGARRGVDGAWCCACDEVEVSPRYDVMADHILMLNARHVKRDFDCCCCSIILFVYDVSCGCNSCDANETSRDIA